MIIYLAGPLFSLAERRFNEEFAKTLERSFLPSMVILPEDHAAKIDEADGFSDRMYTFALDAINHSDAVVAILDGTDADSGTCIEIGYAKAKSKFVIGVRTDFRSGEDRGLNLMVSNICTHLVVRPSTSVNLDELAEEVARTWLPAPWAFRPIPTNLPWHERLTPRRVARPDRACGQRPRAFGRKTAAANRPSGQAAKNDRQERPVAD